jgi:hypothetical protein
MRGLLHRCVLVAVSVLFASVAAPEVVSAASVAAPARSSVAVSVSVTPSAIAGDVVLLSGRVVAVRDGATVAGRSVVLQTKSETGVWGPAPFQLTTDERGRFRLRYRSSSSATFRALVGSAVSNTVRLVVAPKVEVAVDPAVFVRTVGSSVTFSGRVDPYLPDGVAQLQLLRRDRWVTVASQSVAATSAYMLPYRFVRTGKVSLRIRVVPNMWFLTSWASDPVTFSIR